MTTYRLNATISPELYDVFTAYCFILGMTGCEEQDVPGGVNIKTYFTEEETARKAARELNNQNRSIPCTIEAIEDRDWNEKWRASMQPAHLAVGWYVSPVWRPPPRTAKNWIKIEPKQAFGTGHHETTRLAAQALIARQEKITGARILDIGTGSGILCFVADHCGARFCAGIEIDPCCRENLAENLALNPSSGAIGPVIGSPECLISRALFDCIVMNMLFSESASLLGTVSTLLSSKGTLIWSGILSDENRDAVATAARYGYALVSEKCENEWWCGVFELPQ